MKNVILINLRGQRSRAIVAKELGITTQGLGMIERGDRIPRPDLMKRIADYYDKTVDEIFFEINRYEMCQKSKSLDPRTGTARRKESVPVKVERRVKGRRTG